MHLELKFSQKSFIIDILYNANNNFTLDMQFLISLNNITGIQNFESLWRPFWPLHRTSNYSPQIDDQSSCHVTSLTTIYDSFSKAFPFVFMHDNKLLCTLNYFEWSLKGKKRPKSLDRISKLYQPLRSSTLLRKYNSKYEGNLTFSL